MLLMLFDQFACPEYKDEAQKSRKSGSFTEKSHLFGLTDTTERIHDETTLNADTLGTFLPKNRVTS